MRDEEDHFHSLDAAERMDGRCDVCQQWSEHGMTIDAGAAVCDECLEGEDVSAVE